MTLSLRERLEMAAKNSDAVLENNNDTQVEKRPFKQDIVETAQDDNYEEDDYSTDELEETPQDAQDDSQKEEEPSIKEEISHEVDIDSLVKKVLDMNELITTYDEYTMSYIQDSLKKNDKASVISCIINMDSSYSNNILKLKDLIKMDGSDRAFAIIELDNIEGLARLVESFNPTYHYNSEQSTILIKKDLTKAIESLDNNVLDKMLPLLELLEIAKG